jgi:hypothetical protein
MKFEKISTLNFLQAIGNIYFQVVPEKYKVYCILNAQVCQEVLRHFDIPALFLPTQLRCVTEKHNYVVGFTGSAPQENIWDGHAVCATPEYIFDASLTHFRKEYGLDVPDVAICERFKIPSHVLGRQDLPTGARLWWYDAPTMPQRHPVMEDVAAVKSLAADLIHHLEQMFPVGLGAEVPSEPVVPFPRSAA